METLSDKRIVELEIKANEIRKSILEMLYNAKSGHTAGPLDMTDVFTYLYFEAMKHQPDNPKWQDRDLLVLSNGHICPVLYATMAHSGYFPIEELNTLRKFGSRLQGHPHREFFPYIETSSGPLGEGLSQATGMAIALRINKNTNRKIYCLLGDGELNEGQNWEAIMLASKEKLNNLIVIVDRNKIQIDGSTEIVMPLGDLLSKFKSFGWNGEEIDGHDFRQINHAVFNAKNEQEKPYVIVAKTIPSKGVKEWEGNYKWHGVAPNKEEFEMAMKELEKLNSNL